MDVNCLKHFAYANRCFSCDHWSCPKCNLIRGNGMSVESMVDDVISCRQIDEKVYLGGVFLTLIEPFALLKVVILHYQKKEKYNKIVRTLTITMQQIIPLIKDF